MDRQNLVRQYAKQYKNSLPRLGQWLCHIVLLGQLFSAQSIVADPIKRITYDYDALSRLTRIMLPNGVNTVYQYDAYSAVLHLNHYQDIADTTLITGFTYTYNQDGTIRERARQNALKQQAIEHYTYDINERLKKYTCSGALCPQDSQHQMISTQNYTFDAFGNITRVMSNYTTTRYHYDPVSPTRLLRYDNSNGTYPNSTTLIYDRDGNITQDGQGDHLLYGPLDQLQSVTNQQGTTHYIYNGAGRQTGEVAPAQQTTYLIYGQAQLLNTITIGHQTSFLYGLNRIGNQHQQSMRYDLTDQNQSVVAMVTQNPSDLTIHRFAYSPYGIERELNLLKDHADPMQHFGFDGQLTDRQTNWQFLGQGYRAYNPKLRRFMQQDSLSPFAEGGLNGYRFGNNNPIMMHDPSGHLSQWENIGIGLVIDVVAGIFTSEMGAWGAWMVNTIFSAVGANLDTIYAAAHGQAISINKIIINTTTMVALNLVHQGYTYATEKVMISPEVAASTNHILEDASVSKTYFDTPTEPEPSPEPQQEIAEPNQGPAPSAPPPQEGLKRAVKRRIIPYVGNGAEIRVPPHIQTPEDFRQFLSNEAPRVDYQRISASTSTFRGTRSINLIKLHGNIPGLGAYRPRYSLPNPFEETINDQPPIIVRAETDPSKITYGFKLPHTQD